MPATPDPKKRELFWPRYLLAVLLLAGIVYAVPIREVWNALKTSRPMPLIAALAILLAGRLLVSVRTKILTDGQDLSLSTVRLFEISCASTFYGVALPGSFSGGIVRWYRLSRPDGNRSGALAAVASERAVDFLVLALFGLLCWMADAQPDRPPVVAWGLSAAAGICLLITLFAFTGLWGMTDMKIRGIAHRMKFLPEAAVGSIARIAGAFALYREMGRNKLFLLFGVSILFHALVTVSQYLMIVSLGLGVSLISIGWVRAFTVFLTAVPLTPSGLGVREVSLVMLLLPIGVSAPQAIAFSLLQFAGLLLIALVGALFDFRRYLFP
jgi:uncharacterized protein (TIRG00374 family)